MLSRALPAQPEAAGMSPTDRVVVLAGIASVLSSIGMQRKKAIVMKEFITSLIPGLVQARKVGAAEMGVHPAAGLAALNMASGGASGAGALNLGEGEVENGIDEFLGLLGSIYGIPDSRVSLLGAGPRTPSGHDETDQTSSRASKAVVDEILRVSSLRSFGSQSLKLDILRMCINFCEALPDFNGVLHFTALLLRMAGPGTAPKSNSTDVFVSLAREEQVRLFANISRTVAAANKLGLQHVETEYWDDFLVRGVFIMEEPVPLRLTHHRPAELSTGSAAKQGPFIHNPWLKKPDASAAETILVANEEYRFIIALQNPYDFELEIQSLKIAADGVTFDAYEKQFTLGPYRTQKFPITAIARTSGSLSINGCYIKVTGCRERLFPVFPDPWRPERESKMKRIGLKACIGAPDSRPSSAAASKVTSPASAPKPQTLSFTVIPDQPVAVVTDVSLPQGALMVLEGESRRFSITLRNVSKTTAIDFVHISFQDSATSSLQAATTNRDLPAAELHELEVQLAQYPALRWCGKEEESIHIKPGEKAIFEIEVAGRARLTDAVIQFDYANLGKRRSEIKDRFFTRQLSVPISVTVNASVQLQRPDILPLSEDFAWSQQTNCPRASSLTSPPASTVTPSILIDQSDTGFQTFLRHARIAGHSDEYCMLLLDLRNAWPNPLSISLQARAPLSKDEEGSDSWSKAYNVNELIQPGHTKRIVLVLPKLHIQDPHASVPSLNPANQRQFVVSASKISPEAERANREAFWYRHELLKCVRGTWKEESNHRTGIVDLRNIRFSPRMVEAIKLEDIAIETFIVPDISPSSPSSSSTSSTTADSDPDPDTKITRLSTSKYQIPVNTFLTLRTKITNRSSAPISPLLRLLPHLANVPHNVALDLDKRFSWTGVLQRRLERLEPGMSVESELGIVALCAGAFEIGVSVEEVEVLEVEDGGKDGKRGRSGTGLSELGMGRVLGDVGLRCWHKREPCCIVARRGVAE